MADHYESHLNICADDKTKRRLVDFVSQLDMDGMEVPHYVCDEEVGGQYGEAGEELMKLLCKEFPDSLLIVDSEGACTDREYWYNGRNTTVEPSIAAPDYVELGIPPKDIGFIDAGEMTATAAKTPAGNLFPVRIGDDENPGFVLCLDGKEIVRVQYSADSKELQVVSNQPAQG